MPASFNWTTFLLGFAIALWIAIVLLFVMPWDDADETVVCPGHGCCSGCWSPLPTGDGRLWIPGGKLPYFCTNNDNGGGYIEDNGGAYIEDNGGTNVEDGTPRVPAPLDTHLGDSEGRAQKEFGCSTNDNGGGYIEDAIGRIVSVPLPKDGGFKCWSNNGNAVVLSADDKMIAIDKFTNIIPGVEVSNPSPVATIKSGYVSVNAYLYCMVPTLLSDPFILEKDGTCVTQETGMCP